MPYKDVGPIANFALEYFCRQLEGDEELNWCSWAGVYHMSLLHEQWSVRGQWAFINREARE